ncbi:NfeD family protein [Novosphingobium sp. Gsoil 351]|uniref:NfeD family protein n=1 Tax=Novosphingobium sp. Gsoil 351 TaxID=2675225 RepID=UPI0012B46351|nr:NfeD family protein [Novosphingobium sp. Gsoil 351]QGN55241.1 NfeD family protein [Novosphingobium sp. Gsoil 351]
MFDSFDPQWTWLVLGLVLAIAEMVVPGVFLIWFAAAAMIVGLLGFLLPLPLPLEVVLFAGLAVVNVLAGRRWLRGHPVESADPLLNQRGQQLVGRKVVVTHAIEGGSGRVRCGDTEWLAQGPDAIPGTKLTVTGSTGSTLIVDAVP